MIPLCYQQDLDYFITVLRFDLPKVNTWCTAASFSHTWVLSYSCVPRSIACCKLGHTNRTLMSAKAFNTNYSLYITCLVTSLAGAHIRTFPGPSFGLLSLPYLARQVLGLIQTNPLSCYLHLHALPDLHESSHPKLTPGTSFIRGVG